MLFRKAAQLAALSSLALMSSPAAALEGCWYPNEIRAARLIELETKLMVGTLKCRREMPVVVEYYNAFAETHRDFLRAQYPIIAGHFIREDGAVPGEWRSSYDRYRTIAANNYSATPAGPAAGDCARVASLARVAARVSSEELLLLAESVVNVESTGACPAPEAGLVVGAPPSRGSGVAVWRGAERGPPALQEAAPACGFIEASTVPPPAAEPALAEAPPPEASVTAPTRPAAPQASTADALSAAVAALQAATAALQVAMSVQE